MIRVRPRPSLGGEEIKGGLARHREVHLLFLPCDLAILYVVDNHSDQVQNFHQVVAVLLRSGWVVVDGGVVGRVQSVWNGTIIGSSTAPREWPFG